MVKRQSRWLVASPRLRAAKRKGQRDLRDKETPPYVSEKRTLAEHGDVPVRRSVHDCATRGNPHMLSFTCTVFKGEQESWGAESAIAPRLAAARMAWLAEILHLSADVLQVVSAR